jgi:hypothetical protein
MWPGLAVVKKYEISMVNKPVSWTNITKRKTHEYADPIE